MFFFGFPVNFLPWMSTELAQNGHVAKAAVIGSGKDSLVGGLEPIKLA